jgi:dipeptidase E
VLRLALYCDQRAPFTDAVDDAVRAWLAVGSTIGYLPSAPDLERAWFAPNAAYYARLGLDLPYFGLEESDETTLRADLFRCDAIHLSGGNTFRFLHWLRRRGLLGELRRYAQDGGVLVGVSAGAVLMTSEVGTALMCGDVPYEGIDGGAGLALVNFAFVPHFDGSTTMTDALLRFSRGFDGDVHAVPDDGGIVVEGDRVNLIGKVVTARAGGLIEFH